MVNYSLANTAYNPPAYRNYEPILRGTMTRVVVSSPQKDNLIYSLAYLLVSEDHFRAFGLVLSRLLDNHNR